MTQHLAPMGNNRIGMFDSYSRARRDKSKWLIFSLKNRGKDVCMIRCKGRAALAHALSVIDGHLKALPEIVKLIKEKEHGS